MRGYELILFGLKQLAPENNYVYIGVLCYFIMRACFKLRYITFGIVAGAVGGVSCFYFVVNPGASGEKFMADMTYGYAYDHYTQLNKTHPPDAYCNAIVMALLYQATVTLTYWKCSESLYRRALIIHTVTRIFDVDPRTIVVFMQVREVYKFVVTRYEKRPRRLHMNVAESILKDVPESKSEDDCYLCLTRDSPPCMLPCGHVIHKKCWIQQIMQFNKAECGCCRKEHVAPVGIGLWQWAKRGFPVN